MTCACSGRAPASLDTHLTFARSGGAPADIRLLVRPEHRDRVGRYTRTALAALDACVAWRGEMVHEPLTIIDPPWHADDSVSAESTIVLDRTRWWSAPASMSVEIATARGVSRWCWRDVSNRGELPHWFIDALSEYAAHRVVASLFQSDYGAPGYALSEQRYFGGFIPREMRLRLLPDRDDSSWPAYHADPTIDPRAHTAIPREGRGLVGKTILTLMSLERWLGRPALDAVIADFGRCCEGHRPTLGDLANVTATATGHDLSWFLDQALGDSKVFDYGVDQFSTETASQGSNDVYRTTVVVRRYGDAVFSGTNTPRNGSFESGRGVKLLVAFAGGEHRIDYWDGRDDRKLFVYESVSRPVSVAVDPDRVIALDLNRTNNSRSIGAHTSTAAGRWAAQWATWFQNALLTYASLM